jgi:hypothetical protein
VPVFTYQENVASVRYPKKSESKITYHPDHQILMRRWE